jgi:hypothetical protein
MKTNDMANGKPRRTSSRLIKNHFYRRGDKKRLQCVDDDATDISRLPNHYLRSANMHQSLYVYLPGKSSQQKNIHRWRL